MLTLLVPTCCRALTTLYNPAYEHPVLGEYLDLCLDPLLPLLVTLRPCSLVALHFRCYPKFDLRFVVSIGVVTSGTCVHYFIN